MNRNAFGAFSAAILFAVGCDSARTKSVSLAQSPSASDPGAPQGQSSARTDRLKESNGSASSFTLFETGQVRPLALCRACSPSGDLLLATNTPANRLEVFAISGTGGARYRRGLDRQLGAQLLTPLASIPVGLEPVAVAARSANEVWVVNHLSDSVSIVDISDLSRARVVRTLLVGDEPRDIVFAGPNRSRAFITTAHRGQRRYDLGEPWRDPQLTTPRVGRADVWVFDANSLGDPAGGTPQTIITLFCDTPRGLAVSPDGNTVYAAAFHSGNQTTTIAEGAIDSGGLPPPNDNVEHIAAPSAGLIVKFRQSPVDGQMHWLDQRNPVPFVWDGKIRFSLPDRDVFIIDASTDTPAQITGPDGYFTGVGTVLFNVVVNPVTGKVYVSNTEARNDTRFEGPGDYAFERSGLRSVRGHIVESRITVLDPTQAAQPRRVKPRHLNKHINYDECCAPLPNPENAKSLAFPDEMVISSDGRTIYVAAFGSSKIGIFDTAQLEADTFVPDVSNQISVSGGGPSGLVLDEARRLLYVLTRFDNSIAVVDTASRVERIELKKSMYNPEPLSVTNGRRFLYDASLTSSHGDSACASCHIFGDFDSLAWDLGDPDGVEVSNPNPFEFDIDLARRFHPMKGPMTTQSLRGMDNHGPLHWRGDRTGAYDAPSEPNRGAYDVAAGFKKFNVAFAGLVGRSEQLTDEQMQAFTDFVVQIMYPPNPIRQLDNSLTSEQQIGRDFYFGPISDQINVRTCNGCHVLDPHGNEGLPGVVRPGFFGTQGKSSFENEPQKLKIPHLRNAYQKVGMFGMTPAPQFFPEQAPQFGGIPFMEDQVRGFGMFHDGSVDTLFRFHGAGVFVQRFPQNPGGFPFGEPGYPLRRAVEAFILAFDSNLAPIVGQQMTLGPANFASPEANDRIYLLEQRAAAAECDLVVKGYVQGQPDRAGFLYNGEMQVFVPSQPGERLSDSALRSLAQEQGSELTFTCVPPGNGQRITDER